MVILLLHRMALVMSTSTAQPGMLMGLLVPVPLAIWWYPLAVLLNLGLELLVLLLV